jgi:hypothetical protein
MVVKNHVESCPGPGPRSVETSQKAARRLCLAPYQSKCHHTPSPSGNLQDCLWSGGCAVLLRIGGPHLGLGKWCRAPTSESSECCRRSSLLPAPSRQSIPAHLAEDRGSLGSPELRMATTGPFIGMPSRFASSKAALLCALDVADKAIGLAMCSALRQPRGENARRSDGRPSPFWVPGRMRIPHTSTLYVAH